MRQGQNSKRSRGRGSGRRNNVPARHQTFDSNGPSIRIRGSAFQVHEKYLALARDAASSGDRIMAENYMQHAEHYYRIINTDNEGEGRSRGGNQRTERQQQDSQPGGNEEGAGAAAVDEGAQPPENGPDAEESKENRRQPRRAKANGEDHPAQESLHDDAPAPKKQRAPRTPRGRSRSGRAAGDSDGEDVQPAPTDE
jgi:hypothetical protein